MLYNNVVFVYVGRQKYLVNGMEKKICEDAFEDAAPFLSVGPVAVEMNGKWGYISSDGKKVIDYQYERGRSFTQIGYAAAKQKWKIWLYRREEPLGHSTRIYTGKGM